MNFTNTFFDYIGRLLYPVLCAGCGSDLLSQNKLLCLNCINQLPCTDFYNHKDNPVEKIFWGRLNLSAATAHVYFTKGSIVQNLLHELKYAGNREVGYYMGNIMGERLKDSERFSDLDMLIPMPLFFRKKRKRGYNQAEVICEGISKILNKPVANDVILRTNNTESQTRKGRLARWNNIEGKFEVGMTARIAGKNVLLVDDVITTGATLEACGSQLLNIEGVRLSVAAFAYTSL